MVQTNWYPYFAFLINIINTIIKYSIYHFAELDGCFLIYQWIYYSFFNIWYLFSLVIFFFFLERKSYLSFKGTFSLKIPFWLCSSSQDGTGLGLATNSYQTQSILRKTAITKDLACVCGNSGMSILVLYSPTQRRRCVRLLSLTPTTRGRKWISQRPLLRSVWVALDTALFLVCVRSIIRSLRPLLRFIWFWQRVFRASVIHSSPANHHSHFILLSSVQFYLCRCRCCHNPALTEIQIYVVQNCLKKPWEESYSKRNQLSSGCHLIINRYSSIIVHCKVIKVPFIVERMLSMSIIKVFIMKWFKDIK